MLGVLEFLDGGEVDNKIIAVPHWSPADKYKTLKDIEEEHLKIYRQFFKIYKIDRNSETRVGQWKSRATAMHIIEDSHERWLHSDDKKTQEESHFLFP